MITMTTMKNAKMVKVTMVKLIVWIETHLSKSQNNKVINSINMEIISMPLTAIKML